jgi:hypothetical protein
LGLIESAGRGEERSRVAISLKKEHLALTLDVNM